MTDQYTEDALEQGRPSGPCQCEDCACPLHTYEGDDTCIWCQEGQHGEDGSGVVYIDWLPREEAEQSQRVGSVLAVAVEPGVDDYDDGELVLHQENGVAVFDRNEMRGFRAQEGVTVQEYQRADGTDGTDSEGQ